MIESYPLSWPVGRPRSRFTQPARFHRRASRAGSQYTYKAEVTLHQGMTAVRDELSRLDATDVVVSTNIPVRQDGLPYANVREPDDHGVAVYFRLKSGVHCLACDRWNRVADNLSAIAHHIDALRAMDRWGVGDLAQAFAGYKALPAMGAAKPWWEILGFKEPPAVIDTVSRRVCEMRFEHHPDHGGNQTRAAEINAAFDEAKLYYKACLSG